MSSPILPIEDPTNRSTVACAQDSLMGDISAFVSELTARESTLALAASRGGPPPELLEQIAVAGRIDERLRESGEHLRFFAAPGERTRIEVHDGDGNAVRILSTIEAVAMATGWPFG